MAVANTKSTLIQNYEAKPPVLNEPSRTGQGLRELTEVVSVAAADDNDSIYRFFPVHSSESVQALAHMNDAIAAGSSFHIGLRETAANGGGVAEGSAANAYLFGSAIDMTTAHTTAVDDTYAKNDITNAGKQIWELLGLAKDPNKDYEVCAQGVAVGTAQGDLALRARFSGRRT